MCINGFLKWIVNALQYFCQVIELGVAAAGGTAKAMVLVRDMENEKNDEFRRWTVAVGYDYDLSKRTALYAMAGFSQESMEKRDGTVDADPKGGEVVAGILHRF